VILFLTKSCHLFVFVFWRDKKYFYQIRTAQNCFCFSKKEKNMWQVYVKNHFELCFDGLWNMFLAWYNLCQINVFWKNFKPLQKRKKGSFDFSAYFRLAYLQLFKFLTCLEICLPSLTKTNYKMLGNSWLRPLSSNNHRHEKYEIDLGSWSVNSRTNTNLKKNLF
jgi:hypothetical protein